MQLSDLVDKSLLQLMANKRYRLHPVLRQYALAILQGSVEHYHNTRYRHCSHYCEWLGTLLPDLHGPPQIDALRNIENEWQNIQFAWEMVSIAGLGAAACAARDQHNFAQCHPNIILVLVDAPALARWYSAFYQVLRQYCAASAN
jgi:hypothetical protein